MLLRSHGGGNCSGDGGAREGGSDLHPTDPRICCGSLGYAHEGANIPNRTSPAMADGNLWSKEARLCLFYKVIHGLIAVPLRDYIHYSNLGSEL